MVVARARVGSTRSIVLASTSNAIALENEADCVRVIVAPRTMRQCSDDCCGNDC